MNNLNKLEAGLQPEQPLLPRIINDVRFAVGDLHNDIDTLTARLNAVLKPESETGGADPLPPMFGVPLADDLDGTFRSVCAARGRLIDLITRLAV